MTSDWAIWPAKTPTEPIEDLAWRLVEGALGLAQFLMLTRYGELAKPPSQTLAELGRLFAEPVEPDEGP